MKSLNIKTSDDQTFKVDWEVARQSQTIRTMLDDLGIDEDTDSEDTIPLPNEEITGPVFQKALEWCKKNRGKPDYNPEEDGKINLLDLLHGEEGDPGDETPPESWVRKIT